LVLRLVGLGVKMMVILLCSWNFKPLMCMMLMLMYCCVVTISCLVGALCFRLSRPKYYAPKMTLGSGRMAVGQWQNGCGTT